MINEGGFRFARIGIANIPVKRVNAISERRGEIQLYGFKPQAKRVRSHRLRHRIVHRCERKLAALSGKYGGDDVPADQRLRWPSGFVRMADGTTYVSERKVGISK